MGSGMNINKKTFPKISSTFPGTSKKFKPFILMAKDIEEVSEITKKSPESIKQLYETFKNQFQRGVMYKRSRMCKKR